MGGHEIGTPRRGVREMETLLVPLMHGVGVEHVSHRASSGQPNPHGKDMSCSPSSYMTRLQVPAKQCSRRFGRDECQH